MNRLSTTAAQTLEPADQQRQTLVGAAADHAARSGVFADYQACQLC